MTVDIYSLGMMISPLEVVRLVVVGQEAEVGDRATMRHRNIGNAGEPARVKPASQRCRCGDVGVARELTICCTFH